MKINKISEFKARTLFDGGIIGKLGKFVAVPEKGFKGNRIRVIFNGESMMIENWLRAIAYRRFPDKWGRGMYTLGYFQWKPNYDPVVQEFISPIKLLHDHFKSQQKLAID